MTKRKRIKLAQESVGRHIARNTDQSDKYSRGLAGEGYDGGYHAALSDVLLVLDGNEPCVRPNFWRLEKP